MAVIRFGSFEVDLRAGELRKHGARIRLQQQPLRLLALLLERPGEVVTRDELRQAIWPTTAYGSFDEGIDATIHKLRSALGDSAENPRFVETLPRRGYRFIAAVDGVVASEEPSEAALQAVPIAKRKPLLWAGAMAVVVALLLAVNTGGLRVSMLEIGRAHV